MDELAQVIACAIQDYEEGMDIEVNAEQTLAVVASVYPKVKELMDRLILIELSKLNKETIK